MRWAADARGRLQRAALELFSEQGFSATTVPQITARAGLTTRTFFRHFADKREVIFEGSEIPETTARLIMEAPTDLAPMDLIRHVLEQVVAGRFTDNQRQVAVWREIIESDDALRDRDARKRADLVRAAEAAFIERGESSERARMHAELGVLIFHVALDEWARGTRDEPMTDTLARVTGELSRAVHPSRSALDALSEDHPGTGTR